MDYKISQEANRDIENIWIYTLENWSLEQADRYFNLKCLSSTLPVTNTKRMIQQRLAFYRRPFLQSSACYI